VKNKTSELFWDSEDNVLIGDIKEFIEVRRYPVVSGDGAARRAEARFAGVRDGESFTAGTFIFVEA